MKAFFSVFSRLNVLPIEVLTKGHICRVILNQTGISKQKQSLEAEAKGHPSEAVFSMYRKVKILAAREMEGGNTNEYANLVRKTDEYGNPPPTMLGDTGRQGLSTNVGHATGGAGTYYDFGDATGVGFGAAGAYLNQHAGNEQRKDGGAGVVRRSDGTGSRSVQDVGVVEKKR